MYIVNYTRYLIYYSPIPYPTALIVTSRLAMYP